MPIFRICDLIVAVGNVPGQDNPGASPTRTKVEQGGGCLTGSHALLVCLVGPSIGPLCTFSEPYDRTHACHPPSIGPWCTFSEPHPYYRTHPCYGPSFGPLCTFSEPCRPPSCAISVPEQLTDVVHMTGSELALLKRQLNEAIEEVNRRAEELCRGAEHCAKEPETVPQIDALKAELIRAIAALDAQKVKLEGGDKPGGKG